MFKKTETILSLLAPTLRIAPKTLLKGNFNSITNQFTLAGNSDKISVSDVVFKNLTAIAATTNDRLDFSIGSERLLLTDSLGLTDFAIHTITRSDSVNLQLVWNSRTEREYRGDIKSFLNFKPNSKIEFKILHFSMG